MNTSSSMTNPLATSSSGGSRKRKQRMNLSRSRARSASMALAGGRRRKYRGGQAAASPAQYSSAASFVKATVGSGDQQYDNVFKGANLPNGNEIVGLQGQNTKIPASLPQSAGNMNGGKRRRTKRGGYWGQVLSTALVPFGLWAAQNRYSKRKGLSSFIPKVGGKTKKHRKH
uniref:Uncharacterized protein n=1 Tax=viral metagenome TaxID=1070528 RepID=A0A6C0HR12_9ZZZZ